MVGCYLFADNIKLICLSKDTATLLKDLRQTFIWTDSWGMQLNVAIFQHLHLGPKVAPDLTMLGHTGELSTLPHVERISKLRVVINSSYVQVFKASPILALLSITFIDFIVELFI